MGVRFQEVKPSLLSQPREERICCDIRKMAVAVVFVISLIVLGVIALILYSIDAFEPVSSAPRPDFSADYSLPNPWGWVINGQPMAYIPVEGVDGQCNVYTFVSTQPYSPASPNYADLSTCVGDVAARLQPGESVTLGSPTAGFCPGDSGQSCSSPSPGQNCVDYDQLFALKARHQCIGDLNFAVHSGGQCRTQDGKLVDPGYVEEFYVNCSTAPSTGSVAEQSNRRCPGSLGFIVFNTSENQAGPSYLQNAFCLQEPNYVATVTALPPDGAISSGEITSSGERVLRSYSNVETLFTGECDMRCAYLGYPRQLFRLDRADWNGTGYAQSSSGAYMRITHRPTGLCVAPTLNGNQPLSGQPLRLVSPTSTSQGYWWYLIPQLYDPNYIPPDEGEEDPPRYFARPQIAYVPDPAAIPNPNDRQAFWAFLTSSNPPLVMAPSARASHVPMIVQPYLIVDANLPLSAPSQQASILSSAQYMDTQLLPLILLDPEAFSFYALL